jgi:hypothetical protein
VLCDEAGRSLQARSAKPEEMLCGRLGPPSGKRVRLALSLLRAQGSTGWQLSHSRARWKISYAGEMLKQIGPYRPAVG